MKDKILYVLDKIAQGIVFITLASMILGILFGIIAMIVVYPVYVISTLTILFIVGYISDRFNIKPFI